MYRFCTVLFSAILLMAFAITELKPVDAAESVTFTIKNFGINTKGEIKGLKGTIKWDAANPSASIFNVSADVNTINTGISMRDNHLKGEDYFNAEKYPSIQFVSTAVSAGSVTGNLTIKGVTRQVSFPFAVKPSGSGYLFEGAFSINRKDFAVGGGGSLGSNVDVHLKVQAK